MSYIHVKPPIALLTGFASALWYNERIFIFSISLRIFVMLLCPALFQHNRICEQSGTVLRICYSFRKDSRFD